MKNNSTLNFRLSLLVLFIYFFSSNNVLSQENNIYELESHNTSGKSKTKKEITNRAPFYDLAFNMHTTHYLQNKKVKQTYGDGYPVKITLEDINSFEIINSDSIDYNEVELITIHLLNTNDLNNKIDLSQGNEPFKKLKYVFIKCHFDCNSEQIEKFIKVNADTRVFYKIEKAS